MPERPPLSSFQTGGSRPPLSSFSTQPPAQAPGLFSRIATGVSQAVQERGQRVSEAKGRVQSGQQSLGSGLFQTAGQVAGLVGDVLFTGAKEAVRSVAPKAIPLAKKAIGAVAETPAAQAIGAKYGTFKEAHPTAAANVEAAANIASLLPIAKPASVAATGAKTAAKTTAEVASKATSSIAPRLQARAIDDIERAYREAAQGTLPTRKVLARSEARGKDDARFLAERNIVPDVADGKMHTTEQAKALNESAEPLNNHLDLALKEIQPATPYIKISDLEEAAVRKVRTSQNVAKNTADRLEADIRAEFATYRKNYGESLLLTDANAIKRGKWATTPFDSTKPLQGDVNYAIGKAAQEAIEKAVPKDALPVHELNSHIGDIYSAEKFLKSLDGRAVKGGRLGRYFARTVGAAVGSSHGPLGTFFGMLGGDAVAQILQKTTFSNPLKQMLLRNLEKQDPEAYKKVMEFMKKSGMERDTRPLLPAPDPTKSTLNQGRPIPVLPTGRAGVEHIGSDTAVGKYTPPSQALQPERKPSSSILPSKGDAAYAVAGVQPQYDDEGNLKGFTFNPAAAVGAALATKAIKGKFVPLDDIHPDDLYLMEKFIDHARIKGSLSNLEFSQAEKLAEHFGISMDKGLAGVANAFEAVLNGTRKAKSTVLPYRDKVGRFARPK